MRALAGVCVGNYLFLLDLVSSLGSANDFKALVKDKQEGDMLYGKCTA
jgi:hypothetical protein